MLKQNCDCALVALTTILSIRDVVQWLNIVLV